MGLHRSILFHRSQVIVLNRYRDYAITRINATAVLQTDDDWDKFCKHYVWENDGGNKMNLYGHELLVFMKILPYLSISVRITDDDGDTQIMIVGPDGFLAQEMVKRLKANAVFMCDQLLESPHYNDWYQRYAFLRRGELVIRSYPNIRTQNLITSNTYSELGEFEMYMTAMFLRANSKDEHQTELDHTYPHGHSCLRVLVPRSHQPNTLLSRMAAHRSVRAVTVLLFAFVFMRPVFMAERRPVYWLVEMLLALGIFLAQVDVKRRRMRWPELVWVLTVLPFSVIALAVFAAQFYTILVKHDQVDEINTLEQLLAANITVLAPYYIDNGTWDGALLPRVQFTNIGKMDEMIMLANTSVAYAMEESRVDYLLEMHRYQMIGKRTRFHMMQEPLCMWER